MQNLNHFIKLCIYIASAFIRTVSGNTCSIHFQIIEVDTSCNGEPLIHFAFHAKRNVMFVAAAIYHRTFILEVTIRHIVVQLIIATVDAYPVILRNGSASHRTVQPVDTFTIAVVLMKIDKTTITVLP